MIRPVFAVTEPTALPTAISFLPSRLAITDTSSSGIVVAKLTIVAPTINEGMLAALAIKLEASTNQSPPLITSTIPSINKSAAKNIFIICLQKILIYEYVIRYLMHFQ